MSTATLSPRPPISGTPADVIAWQRECIAADAYEVLGKIWMISLEASREAQVPGRNVSNVWGADIQFYNELGGTDVVGPRIAQTGPKGALLILDPIVRADGRVGLPDIPDPAWKPPVPKANEIAYTPPSKPKNAGKNWRPPAPPKAYQPPKPPMLPQLIVCSCAECRRGNRAQCQGPGGRARGRLQGTPGVVVCGPLKQIVVRPLDQQQRILPNGLILKCLPSTPIPGAQATLMDLLIDLQTGEAFLYGGRFEISNPG